MTFENLTVDEVIGWFGEEVIFVGSIPAYLEYALLSGSFQNGLAGAVAVRWQIWDAVNNS